MQPIYSISSVYNKARSTESSDHQFLCAAIEEIYNWSVNSNYDLSCWFADPEMAKEKDRLLTSLLVNDRYINRFKRFIRREKYDGVSALKSITDFDSQIAIDRKKYESNYEFSETAIKALDSNVQHCFRAMGGSPTNGLTIMFKPNIKGFSLWLNLYRFEEKGLQLQATLSSIEAYENTSLQREGEILMEEIIECTEFQFQD